MAEVSIEVNGRSYRIACEDGQEDHVMELAKSFGSYIEGLKSEYREAGDARLAVMAGIMAMDELDEIKRRLSELEAELGRLNEAGEAMGREHVALEAEYAKRFSALAERIHTLAGELEQAGASGA